MDGWDSGASCWLLGRGAGVCMLVYIGGCWWVLMDVWRSLASPWGCTWIL